MPLDLPIRPRRNRKSAVVRDFIRETYLGPEHFVLPLFIHPGKEDQPIASMPGCARLTLASMLKEAEGAMKTVKVCTSS